MKAIIFDLDGVIVHTDHFHYLAWKKLADRLGIYFDEQKNNRLRGVSRMESLEIVLENSPLASLPESEKILLANEKNESYVALLQEMSQDDLPEEVLETLKSLKKMNIKLAIGSSSRNARLILTKIGLSDFFEAISDGNNIKNSKPDPEVFLKAAEFLEIPPADCVVVEDAKAGVEAARRAGMKSIAMGDAAGCGLEDWSIETFASVLDIAQKELSS